MVVSRPRRDFAELARRRRWAARLFAKGESVLASVARQVKASRQSDRQWKRGGVHALKGAGRAGRKPSLNQVQLRKVERALRQGARHHGFQAELWTLPRVATVIERVTGVRFHPGHVWRVLGRINWTVQKPARQAKERDDAKVAYGKAVRWPELKKTLASSTLGSSSKTNLASHSNPRSGPVGGPAGRRRS